MIIIIKKNKINIDYKENAGFVLLLASLISGIVSIIGMVIFEITIKELSLSSSGRESQIAFYAADSGLECALYWDLVGYVFDGDLDNDPDSNPRCNGQSLDLSDVFMEGDTTTYRFVVNLSSPACANVFVYKRSVTDAEGNTSTRTHVQSRGYNTCNVDDPRRLERGVESRY